MAGRTLLLRLGEAPAPVLARHGDYLRWFERAWEGSLDLVDGRGGAPLPRPRDVAAIIVSGSPASLAEPEPWMDDAAAFVRRAHDDGTPVLGVCFGHQLIGYAFGARVVVNPTGWEVGTCEVRVNEAGRRDRLFDALGATIQVNLTHRDMVHTELEPGSPLRVLAENDATEIQALAVGDHVRGVQFHPEITGAVAAAYIAARRDALADRNPDELIARAVDSADGLQVMQNFKRHFAE